MLTLPKSVLVTEVGPRDGLQSLGRWIDTDIKVKMVDRLSDAGFPVIEVTGFAHPRVIPTLKDAEEVFARIKRRPGTVYRGLAPNARGATRAVAAGVDEVVGLTVVSATYLKKNQNMTPDQAADQAIEAFRITEAGGKSFVMAVGVSMWCAYEGLIPPAQVHALLERFTAAGMKRIYLAGSMGMEDPAQVHSLFRSVIERWPQVEFGYHVHNMAGSGTASVLAALDAGARFIEGAICGLGGGIAMPTSVASVGNLATEDLVTMLATMGIDTGIDPNEAVAAARDIAKMLDFAPRSHILASGTRAELMAAAKLHGRDHPA